MITGELSILNNWHMIGYEVMCSKNRRMLGLTRQS